MNNNLMQKTINCDLCVIGGGLAGSFNALAAARQGAKVVLIQDRPMLGGNASSEIRMWVRGAKGEFNRETGMISELEERNIFYNPTLNNSLNDATLYSMLDENENITLLLNTSCLDADVKNGSIVSVTAWQTTTYTFYTVKAKIYSDCSGDSILAPLVGAEYRHGREDKNEYGEELAKDASDSKTMGMSILLAARETDKPVKFIPPPFANYYPTDESFSVGVKNSEYAQGRNHIPGTSGCNMWWVELGGEGDSIHDADKVRRELLSAIYGVWDHIKNHGDHGMENWELEWVGFLPGKRESRRYVGEYVMIESDIKSGGHFYDEIAYGGWPMDDHNPYGMRKNPEASFSAIMTPVTEPYGIPLRSLISKDIKNLTFAGRNISVSHVALSSTRVMATCALLGQALGTAVGLAVKYGETPKQIAYNRYREVQKILLEDGCFLPHIKNEYSELIKSAKLNISDSDKEILFNGIERPRTISGENSITFEVGSELTFDFDKSESISTLRLCFDPDFERYSISDNYKMRIYAMKLHTGKDFVPVRVAKTLVKSFIVYADETEIARVENNYKRLVKIPLNVKAKQIKIKWLETNGDDLVKLFAVDFI